MIKKNVAQATSSEGKCPTCFSLSVSKSGRQAEACRTFARLCKRDLLCVNVRSCISLNLTHRTFAIGPKTLAEILLQDLTGAILR